MSPSSGGALRPIATFLAFFAVAGLVIAGFAFYSTPEDSPAIPKPGDSFEYQVQGMDGSTVISSKVTWSMDENGTDLIGDRYAFAVDIWPFELNDDNRDQSMAVEKLSTIYGQKFVRKIVRYQLDSLSHAATSRGLLVITYVGYDSSIVYKVVAAKPGLHFTITLSSSNIYGIYSADNIAHPLVREQGMNLVDSQPSGVSLVRNSGYSGVQSLEIFQGQNIKYSMTGVHVHLYMLSQDDIDLISSGGPFSFMPEASLVNSSGMVDIRVSPGTYWYISDLYNEQEGKVELSKYWRPISTAS